MEIYKINCDDKFLDLMNQNIEELSKVDDNDMNDILQYNNNDCCYDNSYIENFLYDTMIYHLNNLNLTANYIEFWNKKIINTKSINNWHFDKDEFFYNKYRKFIIPKLTIITYLEDSDIPILIPRISHEDYLYKKFEDKTDFIMYFPKKNTQLVFNGGEQMHGVVDIIKSLEEKQEKSRKILVVNLWDDKPQGTDIESFIKKKGIVNLKLINDNKSNIIFKNITDETKSVINVDKTFFSFEFFNNLIYNKSFELKDDKILNEIKKLYIDDNKNLIVLQDKDYKSDEVLNKERFLKDYDSIKITKQIDYKNRFLQRLKIDNIFDKFTCDFIINQSELFAKNNNGWTTRRHNNYPTTDLPVCDIKNIYILILEKFKCVFEKIKHHYVFPTNTEFNMNDLFIVKYNENIQTKLEMHQDGSFITINILLNDNFEGGGSIFHDGITEYNSVGSGIVHCGMLDHGGKEITKGERYILVCFSDIIIKN